MILSQLRHMLPGQTEVLLKTFNLFGWSRPMAQQCGMEAEPTQVIRKRDAGACKNACQMEVGIGVAANFYLVGLATPALSLIAGILIRNLIC